MDADSSSSSSTSTAIGSGSGSGASSVTLVERAVVDPTVVLPPPGRRPEEVHAALAAVTAAAAAVQQPLVAPDVACESQVPAHVAAVVTPCPGTNTVPVVSEVQVGARGA